MRPFFVTDRDQTVWFCREGVRSAMHDPSAVAPLALLSGASNGVHGSWNDDHANDGEVDDILAQFSQVP